MNEFEIGRAEVRDMQVGVSWPRDDLIISLSVDGDMTYIHPEEGPQQTITGHKTSTPPVFFLLPRLTFYPHFSELHSMYLACFEVLRLWLKKTG